MNVINAAVIACGFISEILVIKDMTAFVKKKGDKRYICQT